MSKTQAASTNAPALTRKDGVIGLWGRLFYRDPNDYEKWLEERDMIIITAALLRLNDRQLSRIGLSRATLSLDVEDLSLRARRDAQIASDILQIVEGDAIEGQQRHAIAAE